jgi:hypothetical protein
MKTDISILILQLEGNCEQQSKDSWQTTEENEAKCRTYGEEPRKEIPENMKAIRSK